MAKKLFHKNCFTGAETSHDSEGQYETSATTRRQHFLVNEQSNIYFINKTETTQLLGWRIHHLQSQSLK